MSESPRVSVAVPLYNEEENVPELLRRLGAVLDGLPGGPHELLFIDDGSHDRTRELIGQAAKIDERITLVCLSRNFGHQAALSAALDHTGGDVTVLLDGDLQDPPEMIPKFVSAYLDGYDVVYGQRVKRKEPWWLRCSYFVFYRLLARMSRVALPVDSGDFGLMSRRVVDEIRRAPEYHRYLRGLRTWVGFRQLGIPVERSPRHAGRPKYDFGRLLGLAFDGIFSFTIAPLRAAAVIGLVAIVAAAAFGLYALYARLIWRESPPGFTTLYMAVSFLSGTILVSLGIIGEYLGRVYEEVKARPVYIVESIVRGRSGRGA